ncbi:hypothetical protein M3Y97_01121000 [Aphelenchoides bicaudatus]|nr:hypothetical protein M3Y97_01121000 [Aphelenchoides bicaudatus]
MLGMEQKQVDKIKSKWCEVVYERINQTKNEVNVLIDAYTRHRSFIYLQLNVKVTKPFMGSFLNSINLNQTMPIVPILSAHNHLSTFLENDYFPIDEVFQKELNSDVVGLALSLSTHNRLHRFHKLCTTIFTQNGTSNNLAIQRP